MIHEKNHRELRDANDLSTASSDLANLAKSRNSIVRAAVARHPNCPSSVLSELEIDTADFVRSTVKSRASFRNPVFKKPQIVQGKQLRLRNASMDDAEFIVAIRNDEKKSRYISATSDDVDIQRQWLENYSKDSEQIYFIIESLDGESSGTVRLYDQIGNSFCWGSWVLADSAPSVFAIESAALVYKFALSLGFVTAHFDVRRDNASVRRFHEKFGATKVSETDLDVFYQVSYGAICTSLERYAKFIPDEVSVIY